MPKIIFFFHSLDKNECEERSRCHQNADCVNTPGSFSCRCKKGFEGNGAVECKGVDKSETLLFLRQASSTGHIAQVTVTRPSLFS